MKDATPGSMPPVPRSATAEELAIRDERQWALFIQLSALSGYVGVPLGSIFGPLLMWLLKRDRSAFLDEQGKEALNFHLSMFLYVVVSIPLVFLVIGFFMLIAIPLIEVIFTVIAAIKASEGEVYRFPLSIRFID